MKKLLLSLTAITSVVMLAACSAENRLGSDTEQSPNAADQQVHVNDTYGYSFEYSSNLEKLEYSDQALALGQLTEGGIDAQVEVQVFESEDGSENLSFEEFMLERLMMMCAADGPSMSRECTSVAQQQPFMTGAGVSGEEFYLEETTTHFSDNTTTTDRKGPFYTFNISDNTPGKQAMLVVYSPIALPPDQVDAEVVRAVAESVQVTQL